MLEHKEFNEHCQCYSKEDMNEKLIIDHQQKSNYQWCDAVKPIRFSRGENPEFRDTLPYP